jgi:hypothetical protein
VYFLLASLNAEEVSETIHKISGLYPPKILRSRKTKETKQLFPNEGD